MSEFNIKEVEKAAGGGLIYLASPYTHESQDVQWARFSQACQAAAWLMRQGLYIFSPIAHTHPIAEHGLPGGWDFWGPYDRLFLNRCGGMIVLDIEGWEESKGVAGEIQIMRSQHKPIWHMDLPTK